MFQERGKNGGKTSLRFGAMHHLIRLSECWWSGQWLIGNVLLHDSEPAVWRRLLVPSDTTLLDLHHIVQIAFGWSCIRRHHFVARGKSYGATHGIVPASIDLAALHLRPKERFPYQYGFGDEWRHQIRFEDLSPVHGDRVVPVCIGGARAGPSDACTRPCDYARRLERRREDCPLAEFFYVTQRFGRLIEARAEANVTVQEAIGDIEMFASAVAALKAYARFNPEHFDLDKIKQRLHVFAQNNRQWKEDHDHFGPGDD